ncbi:MAG: DUF6356 family protein [Flavobacteriales bacterium]
MKNAFTEHPREVGLSYTGHFLFACSVVYKLGMALFCCSVHAVFPFLFTHTTSRIVKQLHDKIEHRTQPGENKEPD